MKVMLGLFAAYLAAAAASAGVVGFGSVADWGAATVFGGSALWLLVDEGYDLWEERK